MDDTDTFEGAAKWIRTAEFSASNDQKLKLYGLYRCATSETIGPTESKPRFWEIERVAKWTAWRDQGAALASAEDPQAEARDRYVALARQLGFGGGEVTAKARGEQNIAVSTLAEAESDRPPLHALAVKGDAAAIRQLKSPSLDARDEYGFTTLHLAADRGRLEVVRALLELGADPDAKDNDGNTALDLAGFSEQADVIAELERHRSAS